MKKLIITAVITLAIICGVICVFPRVPLLFGNKPTTTTTLVSDTVTEALPISLSGNCHYRNHLPTALQKTYDRILQTLLDYSGVETTDENGSPALIVSTEQDHLSVDGITDVCEAIYNDHPELFYLTSKNSFSSVNERCISITFYYWMDLEDRRIANERFNREIEHLVTQCDGKTDFEKELFLHDSLLERCRYVDDDTMHHQLSSPYYALCKGKALCGGYARAMQILLGRAGIDCTLVCGDNHVWNMVFLNGDAYHVDATWNDTDDDLILHHYFNLTDRDIQDTHPVIATSDFLPAATQMTENYYVKKGYYAETYTERQLCDMLRIQLASDTDIIELRFAPTCYQEAIQHLKNCIISEVSRTPTQASSKKWYVYTYLTAENVGTITVSEKDE